MFCDGICGVGSGSGVNSGSGGSSIAHNCHHTAEWFLIYWLLTILKEKIKL